MKGEKKNTNSNRLGGRDSIATYPSPSHQMEVDKRTSRWRSGRGYFEVNNMDGNLVDLSLKISSSPRRRSMPSQSCGVYYAEENEFQKRGSMYQSSQEMMKLRRQRERRRKKIDILPQSDERFLSFEIVDNLQVKCQRPSLLLPPKVRSPYTSLESESKISKATELFDFLDENFDRNVKPRSYRGASNHEKQTISAFAKSFSVKVGTYDSSCQSVRSCAKADTKMVGSQEMLDPIMKSKSLKNPSLTRSETTSGFRISESLKIRKNQLGWRSPVRLHGALKLGLEPGSSFEFSVKDRQMFLLAKAWKTGTSLSSVYTFHKGTGSCCMSGVEDGKKESSFMVGQMNMSCYFCSSSNSMIKEFIFYETPHERKRPDIFSGNDQFSSAATSDTMSRSSNLETCRSTNYGNLYGYNSDASARSPLVVTDLNPHFELAAIVIQVPFSGCQSLRDTIKNCRGLGFSSYDPWSTLANVKVVIPNGRHGLPDKEGGPSSLLERWRRNGGCDCGGWDVSCPVIVFNNSRKDPLNFRDGESLLTSLFLQSRKEELPALSITVKRRGEYSVTFLPQLSEMQAFAICIAILYDSQTPMMDGEGKKPRGATKPLKLLLKERIELEKRVEHVSPAFELDPLFSPIGRI